MKKLTNRQQAAYNKLLEMQKNYNRTTFVAHQYWKDSWKKYGGHEGIDPAALEALEKKGYIKITKDSGRRTGVFNPVADSWGYSTYWLDTIVELVGEKA